MKCFRLFAFLLVVFNSHTVYADSNKYVEFEGGDLKIGRELWLANCETCHGYGIAGAPNPMKPKHWKPRLLKDKATLYEHAINGFFGPDDSMMPERGGNPDLSDDEVKMAVDYMTQLATYYIENEVKK